MEILCFKTCGGSLLHLGLEQFLFLETNLLYPLVNRDGFLPQQTQLLLPTRQNMLSSKHSTTLCWIRIQAPADFGCLLEFTTSILGLISPHWQLWVKGLNNMSLNLKVCLFRTNFPRHFRESWTAGVPGNPWAPQRLPLPYFSSSQLTWVHGSILTRDWLENPVYFSTRKYFYCTVFNDIIISW